MTGRVATPRPWAEGTAPTPEQVFDWLRVCTVDEGRKALERLMEQAEDGNRCFTQNHDGRISQADAVMREAADHWQRGYDTGLADRVHLTAGSSGLGAGCTDLCRPAQHAFYCGTGEPT